MNGRTARGISVHSALRSLPLYGIYSVAAGGAICWLNSLALANAPANTNPTIEQQPPLVCWPAQNRAAGPSRLIPRYAMDKTVAPAQLKSHGSNAGPSLSAKSHSLSSSGVLSVYSHCFSQCRIYLIPLCCLRLTPLGFGTPVLGKPPFRLGLGNIPS